MWIIMCCCGGVRVGEAGHPGPGFDDPELGVGEGSVAAWDEDEGSIDQLWLEDFFAGGGAEPFVQCSKFCGDQITFNARGVLFLNIPKLALHESRICGQEAHLIHLLCKQLQHSLRTMDVVRKRHTPTHI